MFEIKRNTTPTLEVVVEAPLDIVQSVEFVFKRMFDPTARELVHKEYTVGTGEGIPTKEGEDASREFTVLVKFDAEETMKLLSGDVFMDTRLVFKDGTVPQTDVEQGKIKETLFGQVYGNG